METTLEKLVTLDPEEIDRVLQAELDVLPEIETRPVRIPGWHVSGERLMGEEELERCYAATLAWVNELRTGRGCAPAAALLPTSWPDGCGSCCIAATLQEGTGLRAYASYTSVTLYTNHPDDGERVRCPEEATLFQQALSAGGYPSLVVALPPGLEEELS